METAVDSTTEHKKPDAQGRLEIRLLGQLAIVRDGQPVRLPASRKVRALFAFLALSPRPVTRSELVDLLWDVPTDPRGELRWCLSKIRRLIDDPGRARVEAVGETVHFDLSDCFVDARAIADAKEVELKALSVDVKRALADLFAGDFLEGLEIERNPTFETWLVSQRRYFRDTHAALLEHLTKDHGGEDVRTYNDRWLRLAPFDLRPHEQLLTGLAAQGRLKEADEHLAATTKLFEADGLDTKPLRDLWQAIRSQPERPTPARVVTSTEHSWEPPTAASAEQRRASIAIMPFVEMSVAAAPGGLADALVYDVITRLAKLRSLRVIAQGTVFALRDQRITPQDAARLLGVDYIVSGTIRRNGNRFSTNVELAETRTSKIVWAEELEHSAEDTFLLLEEIGNRIVASVDREVEAAERNRAILKPPNSLDAWEAHHRGLWHMYRFTKPDNDHARHFFETALRLDPTFARAHAGLSFTHWQNAFQGWADRDAEIALAYAAASESLMADDRDPTAHWAMGRAMWLRGRQDHSIAELEHAVDLSPNFAQGHYTLAFVLSQSGDPTAAITAADHSRLLSPFDPLLFGMLASRAVALLRLGRFDEAADWGVKAALRPNAHVHIMAVAALSLSLAGRFEDARAMLASIHALESYSFSDFLAAFQFSPKDVQTLRKGAARIGLR